MKSKVISFCVLLICSKIVDSIPHSEGHLRQRVKLPSKWQVNQNAKDAQYLNTDLTQTQNVNTLTNSAIQQESNQDYYSNQGIYNYNGYNGGYNKNPVFSSSGKELLESFPSQVGFDSQQIGNQNWQSRSAPSAVHIADNERTLLNTDHYLGPVKYQNNAPSLNQRFNQHDTSYLTRQNLQYPLAGNAGDNFRTSHVTNSAPLFGSNSHVPYENYGESQAGDSVIKDRLTFGQRYLQNLVPQSENLYQEVPADIATATLIDQSKNIKNVENYSSRSDSSNTASTTNYDNYSSVSRRRRDPVPYDSYGGVQAAASEVRPSLTGGLRYDQNLASQFDNDNNDFSAVTATDVLEGGSQNIRYKKRDNYNLRSDSSSSSSNQDNSFPVIFGADNTDSDYKPSNPAPENIEKKVPVDFSKILTNKPARRFVHTLNYRSEPELRNSAHDNYFNGAPTFISETAEERSGQYEVNYETNKPVPINKKSGTSPTFTDTDNTDSDYKPSNPAPENIEKKVPVDFSKILPNKPAPRYLHTRNYRSEPELSNTGQNEVNYETNERVAINKSLGTSPTFTDTAPTKRKINKNEEIKNYNLEDKMKEFNLDGGVLKEFLDGKKKYLVIHPNTTFEYVDSLDIDSHQNSKLRLVSKRKSVGDAERDEIQSTENVPNNIVKTSVPVNEPSLPADNQPADDKKSTLFNADKSNLKLPNRELRADHNNFKNTNAKQQLDGDNLKPLPPLVNQPADGGNLTPVTPLVNQPGDDGKIKLLRPYIRPSGDDKDQPLNPYKRWQAYHSNSKLSQVNQKTYDRDSNPSSNENQPLDANNFKTLPSIKNQSIADIDSETLSLYKGKSVRHHKSKLSHFKQPQDVNNVSSSAPSKNKPADYSGFKPLSSHENLSEDNSKVNPSSLDEKQPDYFNSNLWSPDDNKPINDDNFPQNKLDDDDNDSTSLDENHTEGDDTSPENNPEYNNKLKLSNHNKPKSSNGNQSENDENSPKLKPGDKNTSNSTSSNDNQSVNDDTSPQNEQENDNNSNLSSAGKNETGDGNTSPNKPKPPKHSKPKSYEHQSENDDTFPENKPRGNRHKLLHQHKIQPAHHGTTKSSYLHWSEDDDTRRQKEPEDDKDCNSSSLSETQSEDYSKPKQPTNNLKPTHSVSKTDKQLVSTTLSPTAPNYTTTSKPQVTTKKHRHRHIHPKSTTSSPIVSSTTPYSEETSEDQLITLSPIEQVTDNVSDVPPVTTTTTTAKSIETSGTATIKDANNKKHNSANSSSGDLASITENSLTSTLTDKISDGKTTKETVINKNTQTNDKPVKSQVKNDTQTLQSAVLNSSELLGTYTDVPVESDDNSPVITSPSAYYDANTGEASGDNTLDLEQPETDVTITVSSSTDNNDSEDDIITINIEVSESTGSSSNDKTLLVSIDTNNDSDADSKTPQLSGVGGQSPDCNKDHNDDGRRKNLEIDMSNLQGEPTIWIRTTNQDFIDKLTDKNDTAFDVVYYFNMVTQPAIEREKVTTIHCNGTVVIEMKETTYANKDDPTPTVVKTTHTIQVQDYLLYGVD